MYICIYCWAWVLVNSFEEKKTSCEFPHFGSWPSWKIHSIYAHHLIWTHPHPTYKISFIAYLQQLGHVKKTQLWIWKSNGMTPPKKCENSYFNFFFRMNPSLRYNVIKQDGRAKAKDLRVKSIVWTNTKIYIVKK